MKALPKSSVLSGDDATSESQLVAEILGAAGVNYRHRNSEIVAASGIAGQEAQVLKVCSIFEARLFRAYSTKFASQARKRKKQNNEETNVEGPLKSGWPPQRKKHAQSELKPKAPRTVEQIRYAVIPSRIGHRASRLNNVNFTLI